MWDPSKNITTFLIEMIKIDKLKVEGVLFFIASLVMFIGNPDKDSHIKYIDKNSSHKQYEIVTKDYFIYSFSFFVPECNRITKHQNGTATINIGCDKNFDEDDFIYSGQKILTYGFLWKIFETSAFSEFSKENPR